MTRLVNNCFLSRVQKEPYQGQSPSSTHMKKKLLCMLTSRDLITFQLNAFTLPMPTVAMPGPSSKIWKRCGQHPLLMSFTQVGVVIWMSISCILVGIKSENNIRVGREAGLDSKVNRL